MTAVILEDAEAPRSLSLHVVSRDGEVLAVEVVAVDGEQRWSLAGPLLRVEEAAELDAWLAGLPGDLTLGADEWTALTFASPALSMAGRRVPGGDVELRVSVLGMSVLGMSALGTSAPEGRHQRVPQPEAAQPEGHEHGEDRRTTDVVFGLRLPGAAVERAAVALASETAALRR